MEDAQQTNDPIEAERRRLRALGLLADRLTQAELDADDTRPSTTEHYP
jgi:hypothetical protein